MVRLESISLRSSDKFNERWVQDRIVDDPSILGLGDLVVKDKERIQVKAGRLDLLLQDPETLKRYEVEIQLGATDESHIVRTIEYWDIERKRYPQYEHVAVIVAEDITSRFLNVIQLFNGAVPVIALKMTAYKVPSTDDCALTFVKVIDENRYGLVDDDEPVAETTDRQYWESQRGTTKTLGLTDQLLSVIHEVEPKAGLRYTKHYIGLGVDGAPNNFVIFVPRKNHVIMRIRLPKEEEYDEQLGRAGFTTLAYDSEYSQYGLKIDSNPEGAQRELMVELIRKSRESFGK